MEAPQSGAGSLGACVTLFCERRAWPLPRTSCKADLAREDRRDKRRTGLCGPHSRGALLSLPPAARSLAGTRMETHCWLVQAAPCSPSQAPFGNHKNLGPGFLAT